MIGASFIASAIGAFFKSMWSNLFAALTRRKDLKKERAEGFQDAKVEIQNEQVKQVSEGIADKQRADDTLLRNPDSLRDDDEFRIPDKNSSV